MAPSSQQQEVLALGNKIVEELRLDDSCETLSKWMAHYLAEFMASASAEGNSGAGLEVRQKCCEMILTIWRHRSGLPGGVRPTGRLEEAIEALRAMRSEVVEHSWVASHQSEQVKSPWLAFACDAYGHERRGYMIAYLAGVLESKFSNEKTWLEQHEGQLSDEERDFIRLLDECLNGGPLRMFVAECDSIEAMEDGARSKKLVGEIEKAIHEQEEALIRLKERLRERL